MKGYLPDGRKKYYLTNDDGKAVFLKINGVDYHPYVTTPVVTHLSFNYTRPRKLTFQGQLNQNGGEDITEMGYVYATITPPQIEFHTKLTHTPKFGNFQVEVDNLNLDTRYYFRPYAINRIGVSYGVINDQLIMKLPTVETTVVVSSDTTSTTATLRGSVTDLGGGTVSNRGINFNAFQYSLGSGFGDFSQLFTNLTRNTQYSFNTFATNEAGTSNGVTRSFWTKIEPPSVDTKYYYDVLTNEAGLAGDVTDDGGTSVIERGFVISSTSLIPEIGQTSTTKISVGNGVGFYSTTATGLSPTTTYYFRAFATNWRASNPTEGTTQSHTRYGVVQNFTTLTPTTTTGFGEIRD